MDKSPEAFRTISEVAESLETPAHVLRFWESRFPQIKPVKRAGGRRYYRPADVALLGGIRHLLHDEGMTIRGVQKILREQGVRHVAAMAAGSEGVDFDAELLDAEDDDFAVPEPETAQVVALEPVARAPVPPLGVPAEVVQLRAVPEASEPVQATPVTLDEDVPEAGHIWVEDEPEMDLPPPAPLFPPRAPAMDRNPFRPDSAGFAKTPDDLSEGFVVRGALPATRQTPPDAGVPLELDSAVSTGMPDSVGVPIPIAGEAPARDADPLPGATELQLSGIAARLRALPQPISPEVAAELMELHSRLGLLHAQTAEAHRMRR